uniref:Putative ovule protein n=1 Tax=Solanum chacoense TaxID=4108 RepID=A0A0V0I6D2_SOLCH
MDFLVNSQPRHTVTFNFGGSIVSVYIFSVLLSSVGTFVWEKIILSTIETLCFSCIITVLDFYQGSCFISNNANIFTTRRY